MTLENCGGGSVYAALVPQLCPVMCGTCSSSSTVTATTATSTTTTTTTTVIDCSDYYYKVCPASACSVAEPPHLGGIKLCVPTGDAPCMVFSEKKCPTDRCIPNRYPDPTVAFPAECEETTTTTTTTTVTTTTVTTATSSTATTTTTTSSTAYNCDFDKDCQSCHTAGNSMCGVCKNGLYLHDGECVESVACTAAGKFPVGDRKAGRICIGSSETCNREQGCTPPQTTAGSDCLIGMMQNTGDGPIMRCAKCSAEKFLVHPGRCILARKCELYKLVPTEPAYHFFKDSIDAYKGGAVIAPELCSCQSMAVDGGGNPIVDGEGQSDVNANCQRCTVRKTTIGLGQPWVYKLFQGVQCNRCKRNTFYNPQGGNCISKEVAVKKAKDVGFVVYDIQPTRGEIEMPFTCANNIKSTTGKKCMCPRPMRKAGALQCTFGISDDGTTQVTTTSCEGEKYLLDGACVASCPAEQTHYGSRTSFRSCEKPFVCNQETGLPLVKGRPCACPHWHTASCSWHGKNKIVRHADGPKTLKWQSDVSTIRTCKEGRLLSRQHSYSLDVAEEICVKPKECVNIREDGEEAKEGEC